MTRRERVIKALEFKETDRVPYHIGLTSPAREAVAAHLGVRPDEVNNALGNHILGVSPDLPGSFVEVRPNYWRDEFGVTWDKEVDKDIGNPCDFILTEPTLANYVWPDPLDKRRYEGFDKLFAGNDDRYKIADIGFSLFERAWTMRGMENIFMDMVEHEEFLHELLDAICDWNVEVVKKCMEYPFDAMYFGDDWGSQRGLLMGKPRWDKFIAPRLKRMYGAVRAADRKIVIHSCGKVDELFDDLVGFGLNVFNPFQPEVMDTFAISKKYKGRLAFFGGISTQKLLPYGTPAEVRAGVKDIVKRIGAGGGYIAAPAHDTPKDVPVENIIAMWETLRGK